ncbi:hypothetical protein ABT084_14055 [Streptomyces sp. NPDC002138]|uniref:hypothetical protein n=1 Tax=Streptomyces sp. NPDC002138 TaxID=3154410 RepID=UPI003322FC93
MQRGLVHALAWTLATGAAVTLSWWGVHTVMSGTAYDPPRAVPLTALPRSSSTHDASPPAPAPSGSASATASTTPSPSAPPSPASSSPAAGPSSSAPPEQSYRRPSGGDTGNVKSYAASGGRVVFDLGGSSAQLVSATPDAGWRMQVWKQTEWIRVNFTRDNRVVSVFCTWNGHPPVVEVVDG